MLVQTPQGFDRNLLLAAHRKFRKRKVTDDAQLIELMGGKVKVIEGDRCNFKITYSQDLFLAKALIALKNSRSQIKN